MDRERSLYIVYSLFFRRQRSEARMAVLITYLDPCELMIPLSLFRRHASNLLFLAGGVPGLR
jgi:hypothetical protein